MYICIKASFGVLQVTLHATCLTLTAMTVDRYFAIVRALSSMINRTPMVAVGVNLGIWIGTKINSYLCSHIVSLSSCFGADHLFPGGAIVFLRDQNFFSVFRLDEQYNPHQIKSKHFFSQLSNTKQFFFTIYFNLMFNTPF